MHDGEMAVVRLTLLYPLPLSDLWNERAENLYEDNTGKFMPFTKSNESLISLFKKQGLDS